MELDELKDIWKKNDAKFRPKAEAELASMLKGKSISVIDKLIRSAWFELILTLIAGVALLSYALTLPSGAVKWTSVSTLIAFVGYCFYYTKKIALLNRFTRAQDNLKTNLENLIGSLTSYLKFYKRSYNFLYPVYFCFVLLFGAIEKGPEEFLQNLTTFKTIAYLCFVFIAFYFYTLLSGWFMQKLYGDHLEKLKKLLNDLNNFEKHEYQN
jgi:hypothetical protein